LTGFRSLCPLPVLPHRVVILVPVLPPFYAENRVALECLRGCAKHGIMGHTEVSMIRSLFNVALVVTGFVLYWVLHARSPLDLFLRGLVVWFVCSVAWKVLERLA